MSVDIPLHIVTADPHTLALSIRASCLVFEDPASKGLLEHVQRIAPSNAPIERFLHRHWRAERA